jgi:hypothetical protein
MFYSNMTFIGVDPTAGEKPIVYAAIDHDRRLLALGDGGLDDVLAFAGGQRQAVVAVCGPIQPNLGLLKKVEVRDRLVPPPTPGRWENARLAEYCLRQHNFHVPLTPGDEESCPNWMRQSFLFHRRLIEMGYKKYLEPNADRWILEVYPHAAFSVLLEQLPFPKNSLEGRLQRQLVLFLRELDVPDPMNIFEEITRHRLLKGILPLDTLFSAPELDALIAAYTAWLAASQPNQVTLLGDPDEGQVVLPTANLKSRY